MAANGETGLCTFVLPLSKTATWSVRWLARSMTGLLRFIPDWSAKGVVSNTGFVPDSSFIPFLSSSSSAKFASVFISTSGSELGWNASCIKKTVVQHSWHILSVFGNMKISFIRSSLYVSVIPGVIQTVQSTQDPPYTVSLIGHSMWNGSCLMFKNTVILTVLSLNILQVATLCLIFWLDALHEFAVDNCRLELSGFAFRQASKYNAKMWEIYQMLHLPLDAVTSTEKMVPLITKTVICTVHYQFIFLSESLASFVSTGL